MADSGTVSPHRIWGAVTQKKSAEDSGRKLDGNLAGNPLTAPALAQRRDMREDDQACLDNWRGLVAVSPAMREVRRQVEQVAGVDTPVLLLGESGTGKEVIARMIHKLSSRSGRKFLKVNCAALPIELLESELFGHETGTLNGVRRARPGKLEICSEGTILLDQIAEIPVSAQARLIHLLQDGEFSRLDRSTIHSDVRVLAATNMDARQAVQDGVLRADLYYRLNVFTIYLPPLRERREDLPYLLNYFMTTWAARYARPRIPITRRILDASASYAWPGNVRELENFVRRYLVLVDEELAIQQLDFRPAQRIRRPDCPIQIDSAGKQESRDLKSVVRSLKKDAECAAILQALEQTSGNRQEAASLLRISLRSLHYKIRAYGIESVSSRGHGGATLHESAGPKAVAAVGHCVRSYPHGGGKLISMDRVAWPSGR